MDTIRDPDRSKVAWELALRQHGVIARSQLVDLGFTNEAIAHRVRNGRLRRTLPAVYAVVRAELTREGRWRAALLWAGDEAALSRSTAGSNWGIGDPWAMTEIVMPRGRRLRSKGVMVHRTLHLPPEDIAYRHGFRTTTVARTLIDLAARTDTQDLEPLLNAAVRKRLITVGELRGAAEGRPKLKGAARLRELLDARTFRLTDSELERRFLPLADAAGLPRPETQVELNGFRVDFYWPELGLVVETDGLAYHWTKEDQRRDRERDQAHSAAGLHPLRFTHDQVTNAPGDVIEILRRVAAQLRAVAA